MSTPRFIRAGDEDLLRPALYVNDRPVWSWHDRSGLYTTCVRLVGPGKRVHWQVWRGPELLSDKETALYGEDAARTMIIRWRRAGFDEKEVNRAREEEAWEKADLYTECTTCPTCGCPGSH